MFENILQQKDESTVFYDYKVDKKRVIGHGFGSGSRFTNIREKNYSPDKKPRALSTLDLSRGGSYAELGLPGKGHSRANSVVGL